MSYLNLQFIFNIKAKFLFGWLVGWLLLFFTWSLGNPYVLAYPAIFFLTVSVRMLHHVLSLLMLSTRLTALRMDSFAFEAFSLLLQPSGNSYTNSKLFFFYFLLFFPSNSSWPPTSNILKIYLSSCWHSSCGLLCLVTCLSSDFSMVQNVTF